MRSSILLTAFIAAPFFTVAATAQQVEEPGAVIESAPAPASEPEPYPQVVEVPATEEAPQAAVDERQARGLDVEEVIVTAQKREESIYAVPIAINAYSGEALKELGVQDTRDLGRLVPGFSYSESGLNNPVYTLRGIGFNDASRTASSTVGVYVDEVGLPYPYMTKGASLDIERVEVLKGPQGTLYGRNTTGGAVNYIAKKPTDRLEYGFDAGYGRFQTFDAEGFVSGPLTDTVSTRLAVRNVQSGEGWQYSSTRPDDHLGKVDKQAARLLLDWRPVDSFRSELSFDWWRDTGEPQAPQAYALKPINPFVGGLALNPQVRSHPLVPVDSDDQQIADWSPDLEWKLDDEFWMAATRNYWDIRDELSLAFIAAYQDFETGESFIPQSGLSVLNSEKRQATDANAYSLEARLAGKSFDQLLSWVLGVYKAHDKVSDNQLQYFDTISALFNTVPGVFPVARSAILRGEQTADSEAVFLNTEWALFDPLKFAVGARYTQEKREFAGCGQDNADDPGVIGLINFLNILSVSRGGTGGGQRGDCFTLDKVTRNPAEIRGTLDEDNVSGKASLNWTPVQDQLLYLSYSRGFKSGSFPVLGASEGVQYDPVTQEQLDSVEVGAKTRWFDGGLRVNFAAFHYDYKDKQLLSNFKDPVFGLLPKLYNAPKSKVVGAELELQARPAKGLFLSAAASYLDTEIIEFRGTNTQGEENVDFSGNELNFSPKVQVVLLANYSFLISDTLEMSFGADYNYTGDSASDLEGDPLFQIPSYSLVNLRTGLGDADGRWKASLFARNVTNEFYLLSTPQLSADTVARYTGMPRTYGVTLSYHFF